ncbi:hypothetical protein B0J12DRAFT_672478 [Macrophomina phaseolina]|uniref:SUN domain-containing protein n=1 Tax=Macrophomina phaseolina TaxID=35725 RepID=A0ABQ8G2X6_9PEZI|nr:hypothetical protein B0J12DRAFT_672478 [Macrophomina phaseolina]
MTVLPHLRSRSGSRAPSAAPRVTSRAALPASDMSTPRRSTRIAARTPSIVGSDAGSDAGDRRVDRGSKSPTNAGQVGRLVTTGNAKSHAYGSGGPDDRSSDHPEAMEAPTTQQGFASSFSRHRELARATLNAAPALPEIREESEASSTYSGMSPVDSRFTNDPYVENFINNRIINRPYAEDFNNHPTTQAVDNPFIHGSVKRSSDKDSINNQPARGTSLSSQSSLRSPVTNPSRHSSVSSRHHSSVFDNDNRSAPSLASMDDRPPTRDTHTSSQGFSRTWGDLRETAFAAWAVYSPAWYAIARRILRNFFSPIIEILLALSKVSAMILGLIFSILFFYLLIDMSFRAVFWHDVNVSEYVRERTLQAINILPGSPIIQPFPIAGDQPGQFSSLHNSIVQVQNRVGLIEKDIDSLQRKIPDTVMLAYNPKTGRNEIPGAFWHALRDNLAQEGISVGDSPNIPSWAEFWKHNKAHLNAYLSDAVDSKLKEAIKDDAPVDKETFINMVRDQFLHLEDRVANVESTWSQRLDDKLQGFVAGLPKGQLNTMANMVLLENAWNSLHAVNFFSRSLGAAVDPHLTSPTMASRGLVRKFLERWTWIPGDLPPTAALMGWEELTDCWCAARSPGSSSSGRAQIAVVMPHAIVPETLVVEHIPRDGTLDIGSAPRGMEVWAEVRDEGVRRAFPDNADGNDNEKPGKDWVRVGSFEYRVDALNHIQAFDLHSELLARHPVNKVVIRVTGTWGRDWACLYRLRMNGRPAEDFSGFVA